MDDAKQAMPDGHATPAQPLSEGPTMAERAHALIEGYTHALETNSPRTKAELAEMRALLLGE
jgi:hypothetical protein